MFSVQPQQQVPQTGKLSLPPLSHIMNSTAAPFQKVPSPPLQRSPFLKREEVPPQIPLINSTKVSARSTPNSSVIPPAGSKPYATNATSTSTDTTKPITNTLPVSLPLTKSGSPKYPSKQPLDKCTCKHEGNHIPRPRNAFILFRQQHHQSVLDEGDIVKTNPDVSRELGKRWRDLSPSEKDYWNKLAEEEKKRHAEKYPGYRYIPRRFGKKGSCPFCKNKALVKTQQTQRHLQLQMQQQKREQELITDTNNLINKGAPSLTPSASTTPDDSSKSTNSTSEEHAIAQSFLSLRNQPQPYHQALQPQQYYPYNSGGNQSPYSHQQQRQQSQLQQRQQSQLQQLQQLQHQEFQFQQHLQQQHQQVIQAQAQAQVQAQQQQQQRHFYYNSKPQLPPLIQLENTSRNNGESIPRLHVPSNRRSPMMISNSLADGESKFKSCSIANFLN